MQHKDAHGVYYHVHAIVRTYIHTAWAQCCLFGIEGNTRALTSGTATLQSRFIVLYLYFEKLNNNNLNIRTMKKNIIILACLVLVTSCHPDRQGIVEELINAKNGFDKEKVALILDDDFMYYGPNDTLNKDEYLASINSPQPIEWQTSSLNIQDLDSAVMTEEQTNSIIEQSLEVEPKFIRIMTYRFAGDKIKSITVDSTTYEEYIKSYTDKWIPFAFYVKDQYGIEDGNEILSKIEKYLSEYTSLSTSDKNQYKNYAYLQGVYESNDNPFYKKLFFRGKRTVTIVDAIFGFPFSTSYELDENIVRVRTDQGDLLFVIKDSQTLIGEGFAKGTFRKTNY